MAFIKRIRRVFELKKNDLDDLINGNIAALIVKKYYPNTLCKKLTKEILNCNHVECYTHEVVEENKVTQQYYGVDRIGTPFNSLYNVSANSSIENQYYADVSVSKKRLRQFCKPGLTPIDKLRLELDEEFNSGANVASFGGRKMLTGIIRITNANVSSLGAEEPHFDALPEIYSALDKQFAANIYLKVPKVGGELELWDVEPMHPLSSAPKEWRASLPKPIKIKPQQGDLIIFNCRKPHAVCEFFEQERITAQVFIGYKKDSSLQLWN